MKPVIRKLISPDILDLGVGTPPDPSHFCVLIQLIAGPSDGPGDESFDFLVCTPSWISFAVEKDGALFGHNYLVVDYFNYDLLSDRLASLCGSISGKNWTEVANKLGRYGSWEFADYQPA